MCIEEIYQEILAKEGRLKRYRQRVKKIQTKQDIPKQWKFYQQIGGDDTKTYQQSDAREAEQFLE